MSGDQLKLNAMMGWDEVVKPIQKSEAASLESRSKGRNHVQDEEVSRAVDCPGKWNKHSITIINERLIAKTTEITT